MNGLAVSMFLGVEMGSLVIGVVELLGTGL